MQLETVISIATEKFRKTWEHPLNGYHYIFRDQLSEHEGSCDKNKECEGPKMMTKAASLQFYFY